MTVANRSPRNNAVANDPLQVLEEKLGYRFNNPALLSLALTHRSAGATNNERLEFLGDSILNFIIAEALFERFEQAREGQLSRLRSQLVKGETLAQIAREFALGEHLNLGEGERKSGGRERDSILADSLEAVIGAVFRDSDMHTCRHQVRRWYAGRLADLSLSRHSKDSKTRLQEYMQKRGAPLPVYQVVAETGEAHARFFTVSCTVSVLPAPFTAQASSRREAEKLAAEAVLAQLGEVE